MEPQTRDDWLAYYSREIRTMERQRRWAKVCWRFWYALRCIGIKSAADREMHYGDLENGLRYALEDYRQSRAVMRERGTSGRFLMVTGPDDPPSYDGWLAPEDQFGK